MKQLKYIILAIGLFIIGCEPKVKEPRRTNRNGKAVISIYTLPKENNQYNYWYVILSYDSKRSYFYYAVSPKPITDYFDLKWKKDSHLPTEVLNAEPDDVLEVMLSYLPAEVDIPSDTTNY